MLAQWWRVRWGPLVLIFSCVFLNSLWATTHWILTEDGRITAQVDSVFHLKKPHDLMVLLQQDDRLAVISQLEKELLKEKGVMNVGGTEMNVEDEDVETKIFSTDPDCRATGSLFSEMDLYPSLVPYLWPFPKETESGSLIGSLFEGRQTEIKKLVPVCSSPRITHMTTFDHLKAVRLNFLQPGALRVSPDNELARLLGWEYLPKINGSLAAARIILDPTDWDAYNWASVYWRVVGNATEALECARKSVHHSPRQFRDIGLHLLGMLLHYARVPEDAIIVLEAALDHVLPLVISDPESEELRRRTQVSALSVGVVAAIMEDYNRSAEAFEIASEYGEKGKGKVHSPIREFPHAIRCYQKMEKALKDQREVLQNTLDELKEQQARYTSLLDHREKIIQDQATPEAILESRLLYEEHRIRRSLDGRGHDCFQYQEQGQIYLSCNVRRRRDADLDDYDSLFGDPDLLNPSNLRHTLDDLEFLRERVNRNLVRHEESARKLHRDAADPVFSAPKDLGVRDSDDSEFIRINYSSVTDEEAASARVAKAKAPGSEGSDTDCSAYAGQKLWHWREYPTVFSVGREKGVRLKDFFAEAHEIYPDSEAKFAMVSPVCDGFAPNEKVPFASLSVIADLGRLTEMDDDSPELKAVLAEAAGLPWSTYELGRKLERTMSIIEHQQKKLPVWPMYNAAGLYWRLEGKPVEAVTCFLRAYMLAEADDLRWAGSADESDDGGDGSKKASSSSSSSSKRGTASTSPSASAVSRSVPAVNLAAVIYKLGYLDDAIAVLQRSYHADPGHVPTNVMLGRLQMASGNFAGGLVHFREAVLVDPLDDDVWYTFLSSYCRFENTLREKQNSGETTCSISSSGDEITCREVLDDVDSITFLRDDSGMPDGGGSFRPTKKFDVEDGADSRGLKQCRAKDVEEEEDEKLCTLREGETFKDAVAKLLDAPCHLIQDEETGDSIICAMAHTDAAGNPCSQSERRRCNVGIRCFVAAEDENGRFKFDADEFESNQVLFASLHTLDDCSVDPKYTPKALKQIRSDYNLWSRSFRAQSSQPSANKGGGGRRADKVDVVGPVAASVKSTRVPNKQQFTVKVKLHDKKPSVVQDNIMGAPDVLTVTTVVDDPLPEMLLSPSAMEKLRNRYKVKGNGQTKDRRWPAPALEDCYGSPSPEDPHWAWRGAGSHVSTWLAAAVKDVKLKDYVVASRDIPKGAPTEPICDHNFPASMLTLDHLSGVRHREFLTQVPEVGLTKALLEFGDDEPEIRQLLGGDADADSAALSNGAVTLMGRRLAASLLKYPNSWVVTAIAALYWRIIGDAPKAVDCLRISLHFVPWKGRDMPLIALANIFDRAQLHNDSLIVANMALDVSPSVVLVHFTMANIYVHMRAFDLAEDFYKSTLAMQASSEPAKERLKSLQCHRLISQSVERGEPAVLMAPGG